MNWRRKMSRSARSWKRPAAAGRDGLRPALAGGHGNSRGRPPARRPGAPPPTGGHANAPSTPLGRGAFMAIPLGLRSGLIDPDDIAPGLLLFRAPAMTPEITWLVTVLGQKIDQVRGRGSLAEEARKLRRERTLFFTIINAVTHPIMLTHTEGPLVVVNARAEELFAASEGESDGRRPPVGMDNKLLSAVLSCVP